MACTSQCVCAYLCKWTFSCTTKHKIFCISLCKKKLSCTEKSAHLPLQVDATDCENSRIGLQGPMCAFACARAVSRTKKHEKARAFSCARKLLRTENRLHRLVRADVTVFGNSHIDSHESVWSIFCVQERSCTLKKDHIGPCEPMWPFVQVVTSACTDQCAFLNGQKSFLVHNLNFTCTF